MNIPILRVRDDDGNIIPIPAIKGKDGKSAYEIAKENGYEGSEAEWADFFLKNTKKSNSIEITIAEGLSTIISGDCILCQYKGYEEEKLLPVNTKIKTIEFWYNDEWIDIHRMNEIDCCSYYLNMNRVYENVDYGIYVFALWGSTSDSWHQIEGNVISKGIYSESIDKIKITYEIPQLLLYADENLYKVFNADIGEEIIEPENPKKNGYTFVGWLNKDTGEKMEFPVTLVGNDVICIATWTEALDTHYTVKVYTMGTDGKYGAADVKNLTGTTNSIVTYKPTITDGFKLNTEKTVAEGTVKADGTLVLEVYIDRIAYAFKAVSNGETIAEETVLYGAKTPAVANPENKVGYTFVEWNPAIPTTMPASDVTFTALFSINNYKIKYYVNDVLMYTDTYEYGADITPWIYIPAEGASFSGWGNQVPATMPAGEVSVYGTTGIATYTATFTIDGEVYKTIEVAYGAEITVPSVEDKEGYTFSGWDVPDAMPAGDQTYDATYIENNT